MNIIKVNHWSNIPENFTGIVEFSDGSKYWYKNGKLHREDGPAIEYSNDEKYWYKNGEYHREDGPAIEYPNGEKYWYLEGRRYRQINLEDYIVLDRYKGEYGIMWYKLLGEDKILEHPDIPGLILK